MQCLTSLCNAKTVLVVKVHIFLFKEYQLQINLIKKIILQVNGQNPILKKAKNFFLRYLLLFD